MILEQNLVAVGCTRVEALADLFECLLETQSRVYNYSGVEIFQDGMLGSLSIWENQIPDRYVVEARIGDADYKAIQEFNNEYYSKETK